MLISIDHGNKQIKTPNHTFTSGLYESSNRPAFGDEILYHKGKYYALSEDRIPYMRDKTTTDQFFIFTDSTTVNRKHLHEAKSVQL